MTSAVNYLNIPLSSLQNINIQRAEKPSLIPGIFFKEPLNAVLEYTNCNDTENCKQMSNVERGKGHAGNGENCLKLGTGPLNWVKSYSCSATLILHLNFFRAPATSPHAIVGDRDTHKIIYLHLF